MDRKPNTNKQGGAWSEEQIKAVWRKGTAIPDYSESLWRWDKCGKVMKFSEHGNRKSEHGWEIDHIDPVSNDGGDEIKNLQPLNWKNNADKSNKLDWVCPK